MKRPDPPRRLGWVSPGRSVGDAGAASMPDSGSADPSRPLGGEPALGTPTPLPPFRSSASSPSGRSFRTGRRTGVSVSECLSVLCATSHCPERCFQARPEPETGRSLVDQDVKPVDTYSAPGACKTHQRCAVLSVDQVHHDLPINPYIGG